MGCLTPFSVNDKDNPGMTHQVPCNKCPECISRRISGWSFRLMQHEKQADSAAFITLTYDTKHVPITRNGFMELRKRDLQLFFKRLRKAHYGRSTQAARTAQGIPIIKYYAVGEYGGKTKRPHYHAIIFNAKLELIQPCWDLGQIHYGDVTGASVGYTLKYMSKPNGTKMHINDDRLMEFSLMSKGLGENYVTPAMKKWHHDDLTERMYVAIEDGKKIAMPRYYKDKIYDEYTRIMVAKAHKEKFQEEQAKTFESCGYYSNEIGFLQYDQDYNARVISTLGRIRSFNHNALKGRDKI